MSGLLNLVIGNCTEKNQSDLAATTNSPACRPIGVKMGLIFAVEGHLTVSDSQA